MQQQQSHSHFNPLHQQLAALLSAAAAATTTATSDAASLDDVSKSNKEDVRVNALESLRRTVLNLHPSSSVLLSQSALFLSHGLSQLLSDQSYAVRRAAAVAYGCLCAVLAPTPIALNGLIDRFIAWALPLLGNIGSRSFSSELALESLQEFLNVGDASNIERYVPSILKACQELLEDERTSFSLLQHLLGFLTFISRKFEHCFQPHFVDIVDVLLGWAFIPELSESDRCIITNSFLQFKKQWLNNLHFSIGLLSKFLGDMEILIHDSSLEFKQQFGRLLALFSCFSTVLYVTACGMVEMNLIEQISDPIDNITPRLLRFVLLFGSKFGWSSWTRDFWRCLTLMAEILKEKFSNFYPMAINALFHSLKGVSSSHVLGLLKTNMQLFSSQKLALLPASVQTLLQFDSPLSQLRLHPNRLVVASTAATYLYLSRHGCDSVVSQVVNFLVEELGMLKGMLANCNRLVQSNSELVSSKYRSETELLSLIRFDLKVLLSCASVGMDKSCSEGSAGNERLTTVSSFILESLNPFEPPVQDFLDLQVHIIRTLQKLSEVEFLTKLAGSQNSSMSVVSIEFLRKYNTCLTRALDGSSPLGVKRAALNWICTCGTIVAGMDKGADFTERFFKPYEDASICSCLLSLILSASYDRELNLRSLVASVLEVLLQARLINPRNFCLVSVVSLDKLSDLDISVKKSFLRVLSIIVPLTIYTRGFVDDRSDFHKFKIATTGTVCYPDWKRVLALKQLPRKFHSQHLVSVLGYISQRWKVPLSSWVQRLVFSCRGKRDVSPSLHEVDGDAHNDDVIEGDLLEKICPVSNLAAIWWATHEAARYCITLRLRTNLGGPTQTFAALERMLLDVPNVLLFDTEQSEGKYMGSYNFHLLPMRLLLEFVEALKKHVYNAYEGSCILPSSPRQSSLFFRANKKVCEEWFSRICDPMMNAGLALHCHDATLHYCALRLQDLATRVTPENVHNLRSRLESDVFMVLRHASLALCRTHDSSALIGLQKWASMTFPFLFADEKPLDTRNLSWMTGLAYQAQGQYEKAAAHFSHLLQSEDTLTSMGSEGIQFVIARVIESYTSLSDWKSFDIWLTELQSLRAAHAGKTYSGALTAAGNEINAIHALARFDEGDIHGSWGYLDLTPKSSNELTLDPKLALERSEQMLLRSMLQRDGSGDLEKARLMLEESLSLVPLDGLNEVSACAVQFHCINAFEEGLKYEGLDEPIQMLGSLCHVLKSPIRRVHQDCSLWIKVLRVYRTVMPTSLMTSLLGEKLLCLARKQNNFILADRMKEFLIEQLQSCAGDMLKELLLLNLEYESILLKYAEGKHEEALIDLWSYIRTTVLSSNTSTPNISTVVKAKACLKFSTWLRRENSNINNLRNVISKIREDFSACDVLDADSNMIAEEIVGLTTKLSCNLCPTMGKTWLSYSSWCFHQAKCSLPLRGSHLLSPVLDQELSQDRFQLSEEEMSKVKSIVAKICHDSSVLLSNGPDMKSEAVMNSLVHQTIYLMQAAAGGPGIESSNGECLSDSLSSQLSVLFLSIDANIKKNDIVSFIDELVDVWWLLRQRRVALFGHAAYGYFQYLAQSSSKLHENPYSSLHPDVVKNNSTNSTLRAMLYILHILLNYGVELKETLEHGFASVPLLPWQDITPQLFARLSSHPKEIVRKQLEGVLMMLAKLSPRSIVYPLLVDINAYEGEPSDELQQILDCLVKLYPKLIEDVQLVIHGLGSITVLWEEQWLNTLQDLHSDVIRRINMLKEEAARITENSTLSHTEKNKINAAKYSAMMAPIIVALDRRLVSTSREPQTAHEAWFQMEYGVQLKSAISAFKTPPTSASSLSDVWRPFDAIAASLVTHQRKSCINLTEVAPQLASLSSSEVPIPGSLSSGIITISSFCEQVTILSTKTKPKKLALFGSDGQKYTYLLKGREDLRLDARIMQLLEALNSSFSSCGNTLSQSLSIRYYSVTPISGRAGLIQWVDNVTSMYSIYKSWQVRVQLAQLAVAGAGNSNSSVPPVPRPSDMFYGKIIPALKEKGIRRVISRRDWPHEVKRKVLLELIKDTPKQLLWQEMWCASEGFRGFSSMSKRFSNSVAAMSIVGHILGLGDRHLDNILMDFCNGDIIHIDYNVCFDKGRRLKIPEIVPFRLTQTIETALGLTGIEGAFRTSCEAVKDILCKNKDVILMLLEVFVWDPLVEWTRGDNHDEAVIGGEEKKGMELAVSLSLFASRFQEIRIPLQEHHDLLVSTLPASESSLSRFLNALNQYEVVSAVFYHVDKERSSLLQHETSAKSIVAEATSLSEKSRASFEVHAHEFGQAKTMAIEKAQEAALWVDQHGMVLDALRSGSIPEAQLSGMEEALSLTSAVLVSGVPLTIVPEPTQAQCSEIDREVRNLILELDNGLSGAIESLTEYAFALQRVLPLNYITTSPVNSWAQILQMSVNNLSADVLSHVERQAADLIAKDQRNLPDSVQQRHFDLLFRLERCVKHMRTVEVECSEMRRSIGPDVESKSKDLLLSTFTKYMQSAGYASKGDSKMLENTDLKKTQVMFVLRLAVNELCKDFKEKVLNISNTPSERVDWMAGDVGLQPDYGKIFREFEEQTEKCVLVSGIVNEVQELVGLDVDSSKVSTTDEKHESQGTWASVFKASLDSCKQLVEQMSEVVLPEIIRSVVSYNSEAMEAFGSLSQIRGSIDMALEKLFEVEMERETLVELEKTYFVQVGLITEQQLALEEASLKGRDHLSWEEAEEIATQEDACKSQLDRLHQSWNEKDLRTSSLTKIESNIRNSLVSSEQYFSSLLNTENLLSALVKPFSDLELIDQMLTSYVSLPSYFNWSSMSPSDIVSSGSPLSELMWGSAKLLKNHSFFIWKISILDFVLDSCLRDISSSMDNNFGFDQLYNALKNKIEIHLHEYVSHYLKRRVAPALVAQIDIEDKKMQQIVSDQFKMDAGVTRRVQLMLEEYCTAHETARAARSAIFIMERQVTELAEALKKTILEIIQMEWLHDTSLPHLLETEVLPQSIIENNILSPLVLNLSRPKLLEKIQSSMSTIGRSLEYLQACERSSVIAEGQLERAMGWACGSPNTVGQGNSSVKSSGIPSEFHDHLLKRKQFLHEIREQASAIIKICTSVMEFEASRDGLFRIPCEKSSGRPVDDGRSWQQAYLSALTRLDAAYHSFIRSEQEWKVAQSNLEAASSRLFSASNQLHITSVKAKSSSGDLQETLAAMRDCAYEASLALSSFSRVSKGHTALTSECGSMLEEVLAISEGLPDVYSLGKEAAAAHSALMENLSKANKILLPLEASLSSDLTAISVAMPKERESNVDVPPLHGQALYKSYCLRLQEACQSLIPLVPSIVNSVKELHSMLIKLARSSSMHAGNLHKALEGLGESQVVSSEDLALARTEILDSTVEFENKERGSLGSSGGSTEENSAADVLSLQDDEWISPPQYSFTSSLNSSISSDNASLNETSDRTDKLQNNIDSENGDKVVSLTDTDGLENAYVVKEVFTDSSSASVSFDPSGSMQALHIDQSANLEKGKANDLSSLKMLKGHNHNLENEPLLLDSTRRNIKGKNAYALSVLRQVELKLDGKEIENGRSMEIAEQVDYLLKQATSVDNLCNMYEGWTPWI